MCFEIYVNSVIGDFMEAKRDFKHICYVIGSVLYFVAFLGIVILPSLTYLTYQYIARRGFLLSLLLTIVADIFLLIGRKFISKTTKQQILTLYIIAAAFFFPMLIRNLTNPSIKTFVIRIAIEAIFIVTGLIFWGTQLWKTNFSVHFQKDIIYLSLVIIAVVRLSLEQLGIVIKGDSVEYYSKIIRICQNFSFNPNDVSLLKIAHSCYSYSLFSTIGENLVPYYGLGVRIENIVIWIICIIFVWKILKKIIPDISNTILVGCVACFAFTPLILSNIQEISIEIYVLFFFILFIYFNLSQKHILEMFFALCFVFVKEPDVLILAGYYLGLLINQIIKFVKDKSQEKTFLDKNFVLSSISIYIAAIVFCLYFAVDVTWGNHAFLSYSGVTRGNTFGISEVLIISKLKQLFILNFAWVPFCVIIIGFVICMIKKRNLKKDVRYFVPIFFSYMCFLFSQLFYLTFVLPRYIMLQYLYMSIVLAFILHELAINVKILKSIMVGSICVILSQNFYNIDPISYLAFDVLDTGSYSMLFDNPLYIGDSGEFITYKDGEIPYIQPYGMTNRQFSYFDKILERALAEIEYSENDLIILPRAFNLYPDNFYWGNFLDVYYYDTENKKFVQLVNEFVPSPSHLVKLKVSQIAENFEFDNFEGYKNIYYFDFSFSDSIDQYVKKSYKMEKLESLQYRGWTLEVYKMEGKK